MNDVVLFKILKVNKYIIIVLYIAVWMSAEEDRNIEVFVY